VTAAEPRAAARAAGLRYVTDDQPGIRRLKARTGFRYVAADGKPVTDRDELARIRSLAVPPAYTDVWIAPYRNAHLQATGRDARGRKQYRYHKRWRETRDETKFDRMVAFANALPGIRAAVSRDLARPGLPREKVLATVVSLLESTMIRVGNEEYARENDSYGLTTMLEEHVKVRGDAIRFHFRGKSGIEHSVTVRDKRLAKIVRNCQDIPGHELFNYLDENGEPATIHSQDVNAYIKEIGDDDFTAKDFRTWEATMACALELSGVRSETQRDAKAVVLEAIRNVAKRLGNTPAVCKKAYIFPAIIDEFLANGALEKIERESQIIAFIERVGSRNEGAHITSLLKKSIRAKKTAHVPLLAKRAG
jgi:DNA topoisomerase-1